ncbi:hypothetical protein ACHAXA_005908 [Cyclostephanos tholiformis]|uniref:Uncharacterized protein n=1 Tax=Cyclostephanos tholiformis TaxID=382380 RepID=A0ABD3SCL3_9STRA
MSSSDYYSKRRSMVGTTIRDDGPPQSRQSDDVKGPIYETASPTHANCCTWKVASAFLILVATSLVVAWVALPADDIVARYIPDFDEPANPYSGPEAGGAPSENAGNDGVPPSQAPDDDGVDDGIGTFVPSFMQCPGDGELCCNGSVDNCMLRVDQMLFGLVHNAMSSEEKGFIVGYNHRLGIVKALMAGYRGLSLDVCDCEGAVQFCHNICDLGERVPNEVLSNIVQFLNDYPSEIVVFVFEASTEQGPIVWNDLGDEMDMVDGFSDMIYVHTYGDSWPTMGDLVEQNKRIIIFYMNGGTCTDDVCPSGFHYFYNYADETQFESASLGDLQNYTYSCEITRGPEDDAPIPASFFAVNNFVTPPDEEASKIANSNDTLTSRLTQCAKLNNDTSPNFVYLDFWEQGDTAQWIQNANIQNAQELSQ